MSIARRIVPGVSGIALVSLAAVALAAGGGNVAVLRQKNSVPRVHGDELALANVPSVPRVARQATARPAAQPAQAKAPMAEDVFKNIQVLKGIPVDQFMGTMGVMSAALGFCCSECHTGAGTDTVKWEADTPNKVTARKMVQMVAAINRENFAGSQQVTCWTCHRGRDVPVVTPTLDTVYGAANLDPYDIFTGDPGAPSADQILDKYIAALGGAQKLAGVTSYTATGTSVGFGGFGGGGHVEIYAQAPDRRATYTHFSDPALGDSTRTFDGRAGWIATPLTVVGRYALSGAELEGARLDAQLAFPARIKQTLTRWRTGPVTTINDHEVNVVQGNGPGGLVATLYFDRESGLLVRMVRYNNSPIGRVPTQVDYADYRDVNGIKIPYRWTFSWLDGRDAFELNDVKLNVPVDVAKFGMPPVPAGH